MKAALRQGVSVSILFAGACVGVVMAQGPGGGGGSNDDGNSPPVSVHSTNPFEAGFGAPTAGSTGVQSPPISYHGGPVMGTPSVYLIWYGNWNQSNNSDTAAGQTLIRDFLHGLSGSNYYKINTSYVASGGTPTGSLNVVREYTDSYSQTARLSDSKVRTVVSNAIAGNHLPLDTNGIYLVLTSSDVSESSGFCRVYCGWHTASTISSSTIKYAFIGNANRCLSGCAAQTTGPNGNAGVDGMISVIAHELEETNTDPLPISGWADSQGAENGDKCAWTFGQNLHLVNGAYYNMTLPGISAPTRNYLVQRNLDAASKCYVDYVAKTQ
jgi:hypothetical protein